MSVMRTAMYILDHKNIPVFIIYICLANEQLTSGSLLSEHPSGRGG